jgi:hypothetical protein
MDGANRALPSDPSEKRWFVHIDGKNYGPYRQPDIKQMVENGQILKSDFLWREGASAWMPAKDEPILGKLFQSAPRTPAGSSIIATNGSTSAQGAAKKRGAGYQALFENADQELVREDLRTFFGPRADKYVAIYDEMQARNRPYVRTWNWTVFFTAFPWFFYRKMYVLGALLIFVPTLLSYLFGIGGNAGIGVGLALSGKSVYVHLAMRRLKKADALGLVGKEREAYLRRAGGVSVTAGVLAGLLFAVFVTLAIFGAYLKHHKSAH